MLRVKPDAADCHVWLGEWAHSISCTLTTTGTGVLDEVATQFMLMHA
jgi:hypothetical protein